MCDNRKCVVTSKRLDKEKKRHADGVFADDLSSATFSITDFKGNVLELVVSPRNGYPFGSGTMPPVDTELKSADGLILRTSYFVIWNPTMEFDTVVAHFTEALKQEPKRVNPEDRELTHVTDHVIIQRDDILCVSPYRDLLNQSYLTMCEHHF